MSVPVRDKERAHLRERAHMVLALRNGCEPTSEEVEELVAEVEDGGHDGSPLVAHTALVARRRAKAEAAAKAKAEADAKAERERSEADRDAERERRDAERRADLEREREREQRELEEEARRAAQGGNE